jgi:hypothetical protein
LCLLPYSVLHSPDLECPGWKQFVAGFSVLSGILLISSLLSYGSTALLSQRQTINSGTYGTRSCLNPQERVVPLFFSKLPPLQKCDSGP